MKNGVCVIRVDNLPGLELGFLFSNFEECEYGKDTSELEETSEEPDALVFEPKALRLLKNEVL